MRISDLHYKQRYDYDGCFETTPGIKRAVSEAVSALSALGHEVVPFRPAALPEVVGLYGKLLNADGGECWLPLLRDGPVDMRAMWLFYRNLSTPVPLKKVIRPLVALKSPMLAETLTTELEAKYVFVACTVQGESIVGRAFNLANRTKRGIFLMSMRFVYTSKSHPVALFLQLHKT